MQKNITIESLKEGEKFQAPFLVKSVRKGETRAGKPYLVLTVQDSTGELSGPVWDDVDNVLSICTVGSVVRFSGSVQSYRDKLQLKLDSFARVAEGSVDLGQFLPATPGDRSAMAREIKDLVETIGSKMMRKLLRQFFSKGEIWDSFQIAPAAKGVHHAYIGGLMEHTLSVVKAADLLGSHYPGVDRSLLLAGAFLHDIGKVRELNMNGGVVEYTDIGRLKGHLVIGSEMIGDAAGRIEGFPEELLLQLQHLVLSHHGRQEFGSPTVPMTVESFLLSMVDDLDAKMNIMEQLRRKMKTEEPEWTEYQRILERYLLLGGFTDESQAAGGAVPDGRHQPSLF